MLTGISILCRCLGWYPIWLLLLSIGESAAHVPAMGVLLGCSLLSFGCIRWLRLRLLYQKKITSRLTVFPVIIFTILCTSGCMLLGVESILSILLSGITIIGTSRNNDAEPDHLFTNNHYIAFLSGTVIATIMLSIAHLSMLYHLTLCVVGVVSAMYFLLRNQLMLRRFVRRRGGSYTDVPQEIQRGNLVLVGSMIALLAIIFTFHEPLTALLKQMNEWMIGLIAGCFRLLSRILTFFSNETPLEEAAEEMIEENMELPPTGTSSPFWLLLWIPFIVIVVYIWRMFLSDWIYDIWILLRQLAAKLRKNTSAANDIHLTEDGAYYDTESTVLRETSHRQQQRAWRKALRKWNAMPNHPDKFYAGYRLLLEAPCWQENLLRQADTVQEIRDKWAAYYLPPEALDAITADFHNDRYAENGLPPEAIQDIAKALACIRHTKQINSI